MATSNRAIQPIMDRHYHFHNTSPYDIPDYSAYPSNQFNYDGNEDYDGDDPRSRRYSSPQMGYYDLITGEYRYRSEMQNQSPLLSNYAGETEPPMCENICKCCQVKLPFNCLTISLITSLMLLMMLVVFKMIISSKQVKEPVDMSLFEDTIWLMVIISAIFLLLTIIKYVCLRDVHFSDIGFCRRCKMINELITDNGNATKNVTYSAEQQNQYLEMGEEFV